jgi:hypothetical protein
MKTLRVTLLAALAATSLMMVAGSASAADGPHSGAGLSQSQIDRGNNVAATNAALTRHRNAYRRGGATTGPTHTGPRDNEDRNGCGGRCW